MKKIVLMVVCIVSFCKTNNAQTELWGMTQLGGLYGGGTIYKTDNHGNNLSVEHNFFTKEGNGIPASSKLIQATDGKFYGLTGHSGNGMGVIFQYDAVTNIYVKKFQFNVTSAWIADSNGGNPQGSLIQATNGKLYGMTRDGGVNSLGVLFEFDITTNTFTKLLDFNGAGNGASPNGSLFQASDGMLYGLTEGGGSTGSGVLFQFNPITNTYTKKLDFNTGTVVGKYPKGTLMQATDGMLYGMYSGIPSTSYTSGMFQYNPINNNYIVKCTLGESPKGELLEATDGKLYGMTAGNATTDAGSIFKYDPVTSTCVNSYTFSTLNTLIQNGYNPQGSLIQATDGNFYGMTRNSGGFGLPQSGVIFQFNPITNVYTKKMDFLVNLGQPLGTFMQASDGKLYAMNSHQLFKYDISTSTYSVKFTFEEGLLGKEPLGSLFKASDGKLYGLTSRGGTNDYGVLFQFDPVTHIYTVKYDFPAGGNFGNGANGEYSSSTLMQATDGNLYGMTKKGGSGTNDEGTLFRYNISTGVFTKKMDLTSPGTTWPLGNLIQGTNGKLYGLSYLGGSSYIGNLFEYDYNTNIITTKVNFTGSINGSHPEGSLLQASDGMLYGMTKDGGASNGGVLFQYNPTTAVFTKKIDFTNGAYPKGALIQATDGNLYGSAGVIFQYSLAASTYSVVSNSSVSNSNGSLYQGLDGNFYGLTSSSPSSLFQYNLSTNTSLNKFQFNQNNSFCSSLIEITASFSTATISTPTISANHCYGTAFNLNVPYTITGTFNSGNIFTAQLSDAYGSFSSPQTIGTLTSTSASSISAVIPATVTAGDFYRIRVVSSNPPLNGNDNGNNILIDATPTITVNSGAICSGTSFTIVPGGASTYTFSGGSAIVSPTTSTSYSVSGTSSFGCVSNSVSISNITVNAIPSVSIVGSQTIICTNDYAALTATLAPQVIWFDGSTSNVVYVTPTVTTTYSLTAYNSNFSCSIIDSITIFVHPSVTTSISNTSGTLCANSAFTITINGASSYTVMPTPTITNSLYCVVTPSTSTTYAIDASTSAGCIYSLYETITVINTCQDVWPGDANSDGIADNLDVLELGLHYTQTGTPRASVSNLWQNYYSTNWSGTITNSKNLMHSDCNGDGIINDDDTLAIFNNYNLTHAFKLAQTTTNPQLTIVPDQSTVNKGMWGTASIYLGDATTPITNVNGIAFTVDYDYTLIDLNSVWIEYPTSFINAGNQNLKFQLLDFNSSTLYTATTHTITGNVSGYGKIAILHYKINSTLNTDEQFYLGFFQVNQSDSSGAIVPLTSGSATLMALGTSITTNQNALTNGNYISLQPNPTNGALTINSTTELQKVEVISITGQLLLSEIPTNVSHTVHLENLSNGLYFVNVYQNDRIVKREKIVLSK
ncbi:MAG: T9SS type A sorting domain-containing protein [Burkholderiales bacterium]|nr:T9SS type A sorting domain-containing protein [Bacteroidia bacterium]